MEKLLTLKEVSKILNVTEQTLRNWDNNGKLTSIRTNGNQRQYESYKVFRMEREIRNKELYKKMGGEKWYLREFDYRPEAVCDRKPWIYDNDVIECFKRGQFKWYDTFDECAEDSAKLRKMFNINLSPEIDFVDLKNNFRKMGYIVD